MGGTDVIELVAGGARALVSPHRGGRLLSLSIGGDEVIADDLAPRGDAPDFFGGCFLMAPYAGVMPASSAQRLGVPTGGGAGRQHGLVHSEAWDVTHATPTSVVLAYELVQGWVGPAHLTQRVDLAPTSLRIEAEYVPVDDAPVALGFHPWFVRDLGRGAVRLSVEADVVLAADADGLIGRPDGPVPPGPWDHFFSGVRKAPVLRWPGLELTIHSPTTTWIVYDEPVRALCVEPVTAPPSAVVSGESLARVSRPARLEMLLRWERIEEEISS
ncbi:hypothetical protein [Microbacterium oxydans]|uniref:aldose epimerase family protein n=1 Tax=Microbacterium oxydans TaxID=82380 RepID=UPI000F8F9B9D|nr:hypothetical protein [Microbacterium oxydans]AZS48252.1 hypothetical protein CVS53_02971 [Microbacterium oxydans]